MFGLPKSSSLTLTNQSIDLYEKGLYKKAKVFCTRALKLDERNHQAWVNWGNLLFLEKKFSQAILAYQKARDLNPDYYPAQINLANTFLEIEGYQEAIISALKSLELDSQSLMAHSILGNAYLETQGYANSMSHLEKALQMDSSDPWLYNSLSQAAQKLGELDKALEAGWRALELGQGDEAQQINFGYLLYEIALDNHLAAAQKYAALWLEKYPADSIALHMGNAILNGAEISKANSQYLKNIFDVFAKDFEGVLESLEYQTPQQIAKFLSDFYPDSKATSLRILDAGCGTGLCGKFLQNYAKRGGLEGVDLSPSMLKIAEQKQIYSHLYEQELEAFLEGKKQTYDLIVSADVFTYFGKLDSLFSKLHTALKKSGRVIFSITENKLNTQTYHLHFSGRFLHQLSYIEQLQKNYEFMAEKSCYTMLRKEGDEEVWGYIVSMIKG